MNKSSISRIKALLITIDKSGILEKSPKTSDIKRANKKLKEVAGITGVNIQIEEEERSKRR